MKQWLPLSIALRLGVLFSMIAVSILISLGAYLYHTLAMQMSQRDDRDLLNKAIVLRALVKDEGYTATTGIRSERLMHMMYGDGIIVRAWNSEGKILLENGAPPRNTESLATVPVNRIPQLEDISELETSSGHARALLVIAVVADGEKIRIMLARERSERLAVLKRYAADLIGAVVAGALIAAILAFWIIRYELRPLREISAKVDAITAHRLRSRLSINHVPLELRGLSISFNAMLERLEEGVQRLSGFAADLAHDLRTPMNTLMVETQVALSRPRSREEYQTVLASNLEEYERLTRMIENTLFLARVENAQLHMKREQLVVGAELARIRDYFEGPADEAGISLILEPACNQVSLYAEPTLFQRAVGNLISNAISHTVPGGEVRISAEIANEGVLISVSNTGKGIDADKLDRIFDRYYRGDEARTGSSSIGLGLSIVRAIMKLHGGSVSVSSSKTDSTTFHLQFDGNS